MAVHLVDAAGTEHVPLNTHAVPRIVSLVPSITELLCDLGLARWIVGRTGFCIHPAEVVAAIPKIGGTKDVNLEKIRKLAPTHLIVNIDENEKPTVDLLAQFIPHVIVTHPQTPRDNLPLYRLLGGIFAAEGQALRLCEEFECAFAALAAGPRRDPGTVLYCIWKDPWMTVARNTYIGAMLGLIGLQQWDSGLPQAERGGLRYPQFEWNADLLAGIDEILLSSEPYRFTEAHVAELGRETGKPVRLVDGEMFSWYGSRAIQGLRYLQEYNSRR
ncbi:MAG: ABC transporter substrate-binding protein [Burkholderiaceae bacterium]|nr:ABC transporter substrate-binding protein [Burkholderiaceae bacterium]